MGPIEIKYSPGTLPVIAIRLKTLLIPERFDGENKTAKLSNPGFFFDIKCSGKSNWITKD
jgi:hypothetical protein